MDREDLDAWEPQEPPRGFAERVVATARRDEDRAKLRRRSIRTGVAVVATFAIAACALLVLTPSRSRAPASGSATATERVELPLGSRAIAVLEPGAELSWIGDEVAQTRGNVFYRVEPGAQFRVHTTAGDVTVKGTCFRVKVREELEMNARDVKVGAMGAVVGAAVFVGVYEGRVALSRATSGSVDVTAGQSARADGSGVRPTGDLAKGERAFDGAASPGIEPEDPTMAANASLADSVRLYKTRLEAIEEEKKKLQSDLAEVQKKLVAQQDGAALATAKSEYDLTQDDWKDLAKQGQVKARVPCKGPNGWNYSDGNLKKLGLPPQDGAIIGKAMEASGKRVWAVLRPMCAEAIGGADLADRLGPSTCQTLVLDMTQQKDPQGSDEAMRQAAEIRAGLRAMPGPNDNLNPVLRLLLAVTGETSAVESDLAQSLGPDDAHRIVYAETGCWQNNGWGVGPRPQPQ